MLVLLGNNDFPNKNVHLDHKRLTVAYSQVSKLNKIEAGILGLVKTIEVHRSWLLGTI